MFGFIKKFLGDNNESEIRRMRGHRFQDKCSGNRRCNSLSDGSLYGKTDEFKDRA